MTRQNIKVKDFITNALLGINQNDPEILAIFQNKIYDLGQIIKQRDLDLYNEIIRLYTNPYVSQKIKIKLNRQRRKK